MVSISLPTSNDSSHVVKFDVGSMLGGPASRKPRQISSVSLMTAETCVTETASLTDEEEERDLSQAKMDVSFLLDELLMSVVITTDPSGESKSEEEPAPTTALISEGSSRSSNSSTPKRSSSLNEKSEPTASNPADTLSATKKAEIVLQTAKNPKGKTILKRDGTEIPISNKGWKNLPKLDLLKLPPNRATTSKRCSSANPRRVQFQAVIVRCYDQCIGDNPAVSYGTPISLDWTYEQMAPVDFDAYETLRSDQRRTLRQMMLNYYNRRNILIYRFGYTEAEVNAAEKLANKVRSQRSLTRALLPTALLEDMVSSAARKTKRKFGLKNRTQ